MQFSEKRNLTRWVIIISSFLIATFILWNTFLLFQIFKEEERIKVELWAKALKNIRNSDIDSDISLPTFIIEKNENIPLILTDKKGKILSDLNLGEISNDSIKVKEYLNVIKNQNNPIRVQFASDDYQLVYYGDSPMLNKLKYYPIALLLVAFLFGGVVYNFYRATKMATQNKLWAGMAKETAHQIGTPLSSLIGWLELLKLENIDETTIEEIQKDINRLQTITDRFSKIGSEPILEKRDIIEETKSSFEYLKARSSKQVGFDFIAPSEPIYVSLNPTLHSWTIENLVKNSIDAMKGKGKIKVELLLQKNKVAIQVSDTGIGIPKNKFKTIFEPGYTSKKRGWGLGLSLTKRIVQDYHNGQIKVLQSESYKNTTIEILLNVL
ncbi:sensor histidine kinase [Flavobacterium difficile]|uniref:histidine kinase n=1 Tax=Flavobacterium difficile TaxID=2709659 RepID=A0ABX0I4G8_9FLAO|nr:HAMP domain-containing sensor histidine kinase [Flavobacterium difficile]NHM00642.1 HAMP domain-containing histidine kinase [Flavobacterium difficile]